MSHNLPRLKFLRLLDANYNRAKEGLRVCEDVCRFVLEDGNLTRGFRAVRHKFLKIILSLPFPYGKIVSSRDIQADSGREFSSRTRPSGVRDIFLRNIKRSEEACRVLEEISGLIRASASKQFQKLRFRIYALEKKALKRF